MTHLDDILPELLLGTLELPARQAAEQHLAGCERCRAEAARLSPGVEGLMTLMAPVEPPPGVLARVVAEMEGPGRFARFAEKVAAFFDLTREKALAVLESLSDPGAWLPGPRRASSCCRWRRGRPRRGCWRPSCGCRPGRASLGTPTTAMSGTWCSRAGSARTRGTRSGRASCWRRKRAARTTSRRWRARRASPPPSSTGVTGFDEESLGARRECPVE